MARNAAGRERFAADEYFSHGRNAASDHRHLREIRLLQGNFE
jgi:hypothetical protein